MDTIWYRQVSSNIEKALNLAIKTITTTNDGKNNNSYNNDGYNNNKNNNNNIYGVVEKFN